MANFKQTAREIASRSSKGQQQVISLDKAIKLFNDLANRDDLAWNYTRTACYPRAYMSCEEALKRNIKPLKAWAFEDERPLTGEHPSGGDFKWSYHVAMAVSVKLPNGKIENLVFDPAFFAAPVNMNEWNSVIGASSDRLAMLDYNKAPPQSIAGPNLPNVLTHNRQTTEKGMELLKAWQRQALPGHRLVYESQTLKPFIRTRMYKSRPGWKIISQSPNKPTGVRHLISMKLRR